MSDVEQHELQANSGAYATSTKSAAYRTHKHGREAVALERRAKVATLLLAKRSIREIATTLGARRELINHDVNWLTEFWQRECVLNTDRVKVIEAAELDEIERQAAAAFSQDRDPSWLAIRLKCKDRRAKMLGLDAPQKVDVRQLVLQIASELNLDPNEAIREAETILKALPAARG